MNINQAANDLAFIARSACDELEAALEPPCIEDLDGGAAIAQACVDGISQLVLALGPFQLSALDLELAAALAKS